LKLHSDSNAALNTVTAYGDGYIEVNQQRYEGAVSFAPEGDVVSLAMLTLSEVTAEILMRAAGVTAPAPDPFAEFEDAPQAARLAPAGSTEVLLVGTGRQQRFLRPEVTGPVVMAGVGVEVMDTQAAARTYNILMAEGRRVVAVLLPS
jgi:uncharacterized protein